MEDKISLTLLLRDRDLRDAKIAELQATIASQKGDKSQPLSDTHSMSEMNREELDAKLSAVEARMDKRISDFGADMRQVVSDFRVEMAPMKNLKTSIWSAAGFIVASMIAVIGLTVTGFYTGRDTSNLINEAKLQSQETRKLLEQIQLQQKTPPPVTTSPQK
ncbi:hypothetical protein [Pseudomonas syringae]|uniref:hypothetical protein n=1 Tax=Pseudomonas syringae TaxID=317 RepID=UPI000BB5E808|nr:hypothetical protein [Pseudomonas syringae]MBI6749749.1 hypothetical protein [Pseudomonas syringae]MBI6771806.1 hypothetical protein [Pseudomonas syringae]MBI6775209.1 hypothetical protein [Pseudomonas syringae]MBI6793022.1 hypothetical protein [Pseudomonas syringae]MBI6800319.1 hypothetical protein [Pseudomonas syringae]